MVAMKKVSKRQRGVARTGQRELAACEPSLELIKHSLDNRRAYALVALDETGNIRVHASDDVKAYLDELNLTSQFQRAYEKSKDRPFGNARRATPLASEDSVETDDSADDPGTLSVKSSTDLRGRRILLPARQRRRPILSRHANRSERPTSPATTAVDDVKVQPTSPNETLVEPQAPPKSFRINDTEAVTAFLLNRIKGMQQLANKKIAKAWIKGICPKKQAKYPYQNNKQEKETGIKPEVPAWWPEMQICRFIEPDHIKREERTGLCLHFLRLRPSPDQLKKWNRCDMEPSTTHIERGWTAWLRELAGHEVFDDLPKGSSHRIEHRRCLMDQMYAVAEMEEEYLNDAIDGHTTYTYVDEGEDCKKYSTKRYRPASTASSPDYDEPRTHSVSDDGSRPPTKRMKRDSASPAASGMERHLSHREHVTGPHSPVSPVARGNGSATASFDSKPDHTNAEVSSHLAARITHASPYAQHCPPATSAQPQRTTQVLPQHNGVQSWSWRSYDQPTQWTDQTVPSYGEHQAGHLPYQVIPAPNTFPGRQDFEFPQYQQASQPYITHMVHVSQPEFQATPATPVYSPVGVSSISMETFPISQSSMAEAVPVQHYAMTMAPSSYFVRSESDPSIADFHPPVNLAAPQYSQPYQQEPEAVVNAQPLPVQNHVMPVSQPGQWHPHQPHSRH
ncbi:hypothetical protein CERZMDRAFT_84978 [Cercospora zeae-maydis SCOH1-5]|uniref:Subtelomeric hrmA-associated cluster protein AFUB-079030/YDR124W-like helical bundle domain-containing protein n=1 Tax=Cercospora zeae-maydis SCOH1-5 TaxID=717836 RepID=A0A6A6FF56_9PEZI|nr:hypothetical protein CERZMDRAFT_84978 [Cercospora zeae-maydis SCOH1-5]